MWGSPSRARGSLSMWRREQHAGASPRSPLAPSFAVPRAAASAGAFASAAAAASPAAHNGVEVIFMLNPTFKPSPRPSPAADAATVPSQQQEQEQQQQADLLLLQKQDEQQQEQHQQQELVREEQQHQRSVFEQRQEEVAVQQLRERLLQREEEEQQDGQGDHGEAPAGTAVDDAAAYGATPARPAEEEEEKVAVNEEAEGKRKTACLNGGSIVAREVFTAADTDSTARTVTNRGAAGAAGEAAAAGPAAAAETCATARGGRKEKQTGGSEEGEGGGGGGGAGSLFFSLAAVQSLVSPLSSAIGWSQQQQSREGHAVGDGDETRKGSREASPRQSAAAAGEGDRSAGRRGSGETSAAGVLGETAEGRATSGAAIPSAIAREKAAAARAGDTAGGALLQPQALLRPHATADADSSAAAAAEEEEEDDEAHRTQRPDEQQEEEELGAEEREQEAKIVFYYPSSRPNAEKRCHVGLLEGLITFTAQFSGDTGPLRSVHTDEHILVTKEVEPDYWLAVVFNTSMLTSFLVPAAAAQAAAAAVDAKNKKQQQQYRGGVGEKQLHRSGGITATAAAKVNEDVQELLLLGVLEDFYSFFRLLHGRFSLFMKTPASKQLLADLLQDFCPAFVDSIDIHCLSLFHAIGGFHYGPVDRLPHLHLISFTEMLQAQFSCITHAAIVLDGCLLFSTLDACTSATAAPPSSPLLRDQAATAFDARNTFSFVSAAAASLGDTAASSSEGFYLFPSVCGAERGSSSGNSNSSSSTGRNSRSYSTLSQNRRRNADDYDFSRTLYRYLMQVHGCAAVDADKLLKPPYGRVNTAAARPGGGCSAFGRAACCVSSRRRGGTAEGAEEDEEEEEYFVVNRDLSEADNSAFLFGPVGLHSVFMPVVHLPDDTTGHLLILREGHLRLILILNENAGFPIHDPSFLQHLRNFALEAGLRDLQQVLAQEFFRIVQQEDVFRFFYFNSVNQAVRISNRSPPPNAASPPQFPGCCFTRLEVSRLAQLHRLLAPVAAAPHSRSNVCISSSQDPACCCCCHCPLSSCGSGPSVADSVTSEYQRATHQRSSSSSSNSNSSNSSNSSSSNSSSSTVRTTAAEGAAAAAEAKEEVDMRGGRAAAEERGPQQQQMMLRPDSNQVDNKVTIDSQRSEEGEDNAALAEEAAGAAADEDTADAGACMGAIALEETPLPAASVGKAAAAELRGTAAISSSIPRRGSSSAGGNSSSSSDSNRSFGISIRNRCGICGCCNNRRTGSKRGAAVQLMAVKDAESGWLLGKVSLQREYLLALDNVKATLSDALQETEKFSAVHLASIYM